MWMDDTVFARPFDIPQFNEQKVPSDPSTHTRRPDISGRFGFEMVQI